MYLGTYRGRVKWFNNEKGYGFIISAAFGGQDIFVHYSNVLMNGYKSLKADQEIEFDCHYDTPKNEKDNGLNAKAVTICPEQLKQEPTFVKTQEEFNNDDPELEDGELIVYEDDKKYLVKLDKNGNFNYYLVGQAEV